jgi:hypothetical protein
MKRECLHYKKCKQYVCLEGVLEMIRELRAVWFKGRRPSKRGPR